ncbi:MAG TPA: hypothetical protein VMZ71_00770 [Gemmataceae bacterium]|nr:hypothetical protein [Gemmataceae bacterium]
MSTTSFAINLGGEGEIPGVINQLCPWVLTPGWITSQTRVTLAQLAAAGHVILICPSLCRFPTTRLIGSTRTTYP